MKPVRASASAPFAAMTVHRAGRFSRFSLVISAPLRATNVDIHMPEFLACAILCYAHTNGEYCALCQGVLIARGKMAVDKQVLIETLKSKRAAEGLSLRALSERIGVSFSSLARIERGEGQPDNNSTIRILEWLGDTGNEAGLKFDSAVLVHFRAAKNVRSKTVECLLRIAEIIRRNNEEDGHSDPDTRSQIDSNPDDQRPLALAKPEMEDMAREFREDLGLTDAEPLDALNVAVAGVAVFVPNEIKNLEKKCLRYLTGDGAAEWSAMSVPLDWQNENWAVLRNDAHTVERQRVTYLEECWHILLGHKLTRIAKIADSYGRTFESSEEHDAFYLASACLLPENSVREQVYGGQTAEEISRIFGTSRELVEYRIKRLGLWRAYKNKGISLNVPR